MNNIKISKILLTIFPIVTIVPMVIQFSHGIHADGLYTITKFILAALKPSFDNDVITNSLNGLQITLSLAIVSWSVSIVLGLFLAILTSYSLNKIMGIPEVIPIILRRILTLPRATHELIWGLLLLQIFGIEPWIAILAIAIPYSSLMARVFAEQIDKLDLKNSQALKNIGASKIQVIIVSITPKVLPILGTYGSYRLECAVRGATLLGIFGLGGIGTELKLSIISLKFNEMWTSLWILFIAILILEKILGYLQSPNLYEINIGIYSLLAALLLVASLCIGLVWLNHLGINLFQPINVHFINLPSPSNFLLGISSLPWIKLIWETILLMLFASGIAIGLPPTLLMLLPSKLGSNILSIFWIFCRLIPTPLTTMLLLLSTTPSISVAAFALGIQNMGVLGRLLKQNIDKQDDKIFSAVRAFGTKNQLAWLYGKMSMQSTNYLTYSLYRTDVILRETIVVGAVGGVGLGWQLKESLSSFAWEEVIAITGAFMLITLLGETFSEGLQKRLISNRS